MLPVCCGPPGRPATSPGALALPGAGSEATLPGAGSEAGGWERGWGAEGALPCADVLKGEELACCLGDASF